MQELRLAFSVACLVFGCAHDDRRPPAPPLAARSAPASAAVPSGWDRYVVRSGDTLSRIARCRGVSTEALAQVNHLPEPDQLSAGSSLYVPSRDRCASKAVARSLSRPGARKPAPKAPAAAAAAAPQPKAAPVVLAPTPPESERAIESRTRGERLLQQATEAYDAADFEQALARAREADETLRGAPRGAETDALHARCHLVGAMAAAGLDQRDRALGELRQAFGLDPQLTLDPETTPPRILELAEEVRSGSASGKPIVEKGAVSSAP